MPSSLSSPPYLEASVLSIILIRIHYERGSSFVSASDSIHQAHSLATFLGVPASDRNLLIDVHLAAGGLASELGDSKKCARSSRALKSLLKLQKKLWMAIRKPDLRLAAAENIHGIAYMMENNIQKAQKHFQRSIEIYASIHDVHIMVAGLPLVYLGFTHYLQDNLEEAERLFSNMTQEMSKAREGNGEAGDETNRAFYR